jgi:hypothetical protein
VVGALDKAGKEVPVATEKRDKAVALKPSGEAAVVHVEIDNGYWCKTIYGWKNVGKSKASRVVEAIRSLNYAKALLSGGGGRHQAGSQPRPGHSPDGRSLSAEDGGRN